MIRFRLTCRAGHAFDSWFASGAAYDSLAAAGALSCAVCGSTQVAKAIMAPALSSGSRDVEPAAPPPAPAAAPIETPALPEKVAAALQVLRAHVETHFDNVGPRFAEEARRIHYGEAAPRGITGQAKPAEIEALADEGIEALPLPWSSRSDA